MSKFTWLAHIAIKEKNFLIKNTVYGNRKVKGKMFKTDCRSVEFSYVIIDESYELEKLLKIDLVKFEFDYTFVKFIGQVAEFSYNHKKEKI